MKVFLGRKFEEKISNVYWDSQLDTKAVLVLVSRSMPTSIIPLLDYELYYVDDDIQYF